MSNYIAANAAKGAAQRVLLAGFGINGVGIALLGDDEYGVKVNLSRPVDTPQLPEKINGVPVVYEVVGEITPA